MNSKVIPPQLPQLREPNQTLSVLHGIYAGLLVFSGIAFLYLEYQQRTASTLSLGLVILLLLVLIYFNIQAALKVKKGQGEGRTLSRIMAVLMLFSFPVGTVLGAIALWKSSEKQWEA
ncbi:hypothetical protein BS636_00265 [Acinetobacter sp. LoGeW2-3]|uniref:hypothetical protein n=1 Tax=Acinetobacter sp. LoGeW2-3 TaxID=1808001 RepID=UPI000C05A1AD|nr:hypothetical protein [Acinetobacter sp. LoGeW2-3]ATO18221.1 hypothetical protein BS636_00265 [Acinetobacter sp. LoGeW2-3]